MELCPIAWTTHYRLHFIHKVTAAQRRVGATGTYTGIKSSQSAITTVRIDKPGGGGEFGGTILKSACFPCLRRVGCHKRYDVACVLVRGGGGGGGGGGGRGRGEVEVEVEDLTFLCLWVTELSF